MQEIKIEDYELEKIIYKGGFGTTIELLQKKSNKSQKIVRKIISYSNLSDLNRKSKEYIAMIEFKHVNIAEILSVYINNEKKNLLLYLQYYREGDLSNLIDSRKLIGPWTDYEIMKMIKDLCYAYEYLQRNQIAHRDIKPKNILVYNSGTSFKVSDFGVSKRIENSSELEIAGTPFYLSPILSSAFKNNQQEVKHNPYKSDTYSFGLVILEMITLGYQNINIQNIDFQRIIEGLSQVYPASSMILKKILVNDEGERFDFIELKNYLDIIYQSKFAFVCCGCNKERLADDYYIFEKESMCKLCADTLPRYPVEIDSDDFQVICTRCEEILDPGFECSCGKRCMTCKVFHDINDSCYEILNRITESELNVSIKCQNCEGQANIFINSWILYCGGCTATFCIVCLRDCKEKLHNACHFIIRNLLQLHSYK